MPANWTGVPVISTNQACAGIAQVDGKAVIQSPNFGEGNYGNDLQCAWLLTAPEGRVSVNVLQIVVIGIYSATN